MVVDSSAIQLFAIASPCRAEPVPAVTCRSQTMPSHSGSIPVVSLPLHIEAIRCLCSSNPVHSVPKRNYADTSLCQNVAVQILSVQCHGKNYAGAHCFCALLCPRISDLSRAITDQCYAVLLPCCSWPCLSMPFYAPAYRLNAFPMLCRSSLRHALATQRHSNSVPYQREPFQSCSIACLVYAVTLPAIISPSSSYSAQTKAPFPEFRH